MTAILKLQISFLVSRFQFQTTRQFLQAKNTRIPAIQTEYLVMIAKIDKKIVIKF